MLLKGLILCCFLVVTNVSATDKSESDLRRVLFANYDHLVRPVLKTTDVIPVAINFEPVAIRDIDVKDREVKLVGWLSMRWEDAHLKWDSSEYGIHHLSLPADQVWRPDIALYTATSEDHFFPSVQTNVLLMSNGSVLWVPPFTLKSRCAVTANQVTEDSFQCTLEFGSWTYSVQMLDVHHAIENPLAHAEDYDSAHPKWSLDSMTASSESKKYECCEELYSLVQYDLRFSKKDTA